MDIKLYTVISPRWEIKLFSNDQKIHDTIKTQQTRVTFYKAAIMFMCYQDNWKTEDISFVNNTEFLLAGFLELIRYSLADSPK